VGVLDGRGVMDEVVPGGSGGDGHGGFLMGGGW
jgi:hypothetical protein